MPWKDEFSEEEIRVILKSMAIEDWEVDIDLVGDIEFLVSSGTVDMITMRALQEIFTPDEANIESVYLGEEPGDQTKIGLRINLIWKKDWIQSIPA